MSLVEGVVVRRASRDVRVDTAEGALRCEFRGRLRGRRGRSRGAGPAAVVVGDRVLVSRLAPGEGVLEKVLPRRSEVVRGTAGGEPVVVAANVDRLLIVLAARDPPPRWALVDRMLVAAERDGLEPVIVLNKRDQVASGGEGGGAVEQAALEEILGLYRRLGYDALFLSALTGEGIDPLRPLLQGKTTVLSGHSGVGKSTLLNALCPGLDLETADVNEVTGKGRHTTSAVSLYRLPSGGYLADTPGFREFLPTDLRPAELGRHYPDFRGVLEKERCRYADCLHRSEPDCSVRRAVEDGTVARMRYENYLQILSSLLDPSGRGAYPFP